MDERTATSGTAPPRGRVDAALRRRSNWVQLVKFCVVGATGYVVNLAVYTLLLAAPGSTTSWRPSARSSSRSRTTTRGTASGRSARQRGHVAYQGLRFFVVSRCSLSPRTCVVLHVLVSSGVGEVVAQAIAIVLVTPVNFVGNKLWSFRHRR